MRTSRGSVVALSIAIGAAAAGCKSKHSEAKAGAAPAPAAEPAPATPPAPAATPPPAAPPAAPPSVANAILRPTFTVDGQPLEAGTAFLVQPPGGPVLLVTAHHLFGPDGGYARDLRWDELPKHVSAVHATSVEDPSITVDGKEPLAIDGAATYNGNPAGGDVAAFRIADPGKATVLQLAATQPKPGDRIYLLAEVGSDKLLRHAATVGQVGPQHVTYRYDDAVELRATSGAPLVDGENHVVAINIGGGGEGGRPFGFGNPVHAFGPRLAKGLAAPAAAPAAPAAAH